jgi:hypothetical protein
VQNVLCGLRICWDEKIKGGDVAKAPAKIGGGLRLEDQGERNKETRET